MTPSAGNGTLGEAVCAEAIAPGEVDDLFAVLADEKRRSAVRGLVVAGGATSFEDLVADVARETTVQPVDEDRRRAVATALYHVHLPKLVEVGLVTEFDTDGAVRLCEPVERRTGEVIRAL